MGIRAAVPAGAGFQADGFGFLNPLLDAEFVAVQAGLTFNYGEFARIKVGVMNGLPNAEEFDGIAVAQSVRNEKVPILGLQHVGQRNEVIVLVG